MSGQNRSSAIMCQRREPLNSLEFFPTPLWGTRSLCEFILGGKLALAGKTVWNPACGQGHMARPLAEYFTTVWASDIFPYGFGKVGDFLETPLLGGWRPPVKPNWIIENPPFSKAVDFARMAITEATEGVALLCRLQWMEGGAVSGREKLFREHPTSYICPFMGRLPMVKGRISKVAKSATAYAWFVWDFQNPGAVDRELIRRIPTTAQRLFDWRTDWDPFELPMAA